MFEDKIKLYVPDRTYAVLRKDAESFEFYKKDGSVNNNHFINTLIFNYLDTYQRMQEALFQKLYTSMNQSIVMDDASSKNLCYAAIRCFSTVSITEKETMQNMVSFRPDKDSAKVLESLYSITGDDTVLNNISFSGYLRMMFNSYCQKSQEQREKIIFKDSILNIEKAIKNQEKVIISVTNPGNRESAVRYEVNPYKICSSKEELYNYLLSYDDDNQPHTTRITRIASALNIKKPVTKISKKTLTVLNKMEKYGPQYDYRQSDSLIKVQLTDEGKKLFKMIYLNRPTTVKESGNTYSFECAPEHILQYFKRFGKEAYILEPESVREELAQFYLDGYKTLTHK